MNLRWLGVILVVGIVSTLHAQTGRSIPNFPKIEPFEIDGFRLMLQQQGVETTQVKLATALQAPEETVLVFIGDISMAMQIRSGLARFVLDGGAMLVATDLGGTRKKKVNWIFGSRFQFDRMSFPRDDRLESRFADCPNVTNFDRERGRDLFEGVNTIVANRPGNLELSHKMDGLAWLPLPRGKRQPAALIAMKETNKGRMLLVADHSIFINEMLIHGDNARFASNVTRWLTADGNRKRLVVCHNNSLLPDWRFTGSPPAVPLKSLLRAVDRYGLGGLADLPIGDTVLPMMNQSLGEFERQGGFNDMAHAFGRSKLWRPPMRMVLLLVTLVLFTIATRWMFGTRSRAQRWLFLQEKQPRHETRLSTAVSEKQYQPYLRTLTREFFADSGITRFTEPENYPGVHFNGMLHKSSTRKEIAAFWDIATSPKPRRLSRKKFRNLVDRLRHLHHLQSKGNLELE